MSAPEPWTAANPWRLVRDHLTIEAGSTRSSLYGFVRFKFTLDLGGEILFLVNLKDPPMNMTDLIAYVVPMFRQEAPLEEIRQRLQRPSLQHPETYQIQGLETSTLWSKAGLQWMGEWYGRGPNNDVALVISFRVPLNPSEQDKVRHDQIFDAFYSPYQT